MACHALGGGRVIAGIAPRSHRRRQLDLGTLVLGGDADVDEVAVAGASEAVVRRQPRCDDVALQRAGLVRVKITEEAPVKQVDTGVDPARADGGLLVERHGPVAVEHDAAIARDVPDAAHGHGELCAGCQVPGQHGAVVVGEEGVAVDDEEWIAWTPVAGRQRCAASAQGRCLDHILDGDVAVACAEASADRLGHVPGGQDHPGETFGLQEVE
jgi:hypothetical protein